MTRDVCQGIYRLFGKVQHYAWGGYTFIPRLFHLDPAPGKPYAEYWMGAHPSAPSDVRLQVGEETTLDSLIARDPASALGQEVANRYGQLPFLLKVLDAREMLSIQVHPTRDQAAEGFARENALGVPVNAPERNYKDPNPKPEMMVALGDFWLLHGFRPEEDLRAALAAVPEFASLCPIFASGGYCELYRHVIEMPAEACAAILGPLLARLAKHAQQGALSKASPDYWVWKATATEKHDSLDRSIFLIYFLNLVALKKDQAIYQGPGIMHAYLEGQNIELMGNSDNVLRAGLTAKHVDQPELMRTVKFAGVQPAIVEPETSASQIETCYGPLPVHEFALDRISLGQGDMYEHRAKSMEILLPVQGQVELACDGGTLVLDPGECMVALAGGSYNLRAPAGYGLLYTASVGD